MNLVSATLSHHNAFLCAIPFYNSILNAIHDRDWITFEHEIPSTTLKHLYVRDSYHSIAQQMKDGINKTIITGTPGIGKSLFLIYVLFILVNAKKRVLFIYHPNIIYYNGNGDVFELEKIPSAIHHTFWTADLWCLFDAKNKMERDLCEYPYDTCNFVLSTSPRREMVNDFVKPPLPHYYYMPLWNEAELECIAHCFDFNIDWRERYKYLGGIPRHIFEETTMTPVELIESACDQCNLDDCIKIIGLRSTITEKSKHIYCLVHLTSSDPYTQSSVRFASQEALNIIVQKKGNDAKRRMTSLLESCSGNPLTAALCGYIFEPHAIGLLERGGTFRCRKLEKDSPEFELHVKPSEKRVVDRVLSSQLRDQLYVPRTKNYAAIDAWIPGIGAFQITVSEHHELNQTAKADIGKLQDSGKKLFWVLPRLHYFSFTKKTPKDIDQYVVMIPNPSADERV